MLSRPPLEFLLEEFTSKEFGGALLGWGLMLLLVLMLLLLLARLC